MIRTTWRKLQWGQRYNPGSLRKPQWETPPPTHIYCRVSRERCQRRQGAVKTWLGARGKSCLTSQITFQSLLSWVQQRKINHLSNGRGQGLLHDCLIRYKITPQVWLLGGPQGSNPTASDQTRINETLLRKDIKVFLPPTPTHPPATNVNSQIMRCFRGGREMIC